MPERRAGAKRRTRHASRAATAIVATLAAALFRIASAGLLAPPTAPTRFPPAAPAPVATPSAPSAVAATAAGSLTLFEALLAATITLAHRPHPPVILPPPPPTVGETALAAARTALGTPYVWGGTGKGGFDCSGLVQWAFRQAGVTLPRTSQTQSTVGQPVSRADLRPGDLVFFYSEVSHVGIYVGDGQVLHAPQTGDVVKISQLARMPFHNARRI